MLTLFIIENVLLVALGYFLITSYGINAAQLKAFMRIIKDRLLDYAEFYRIVIATHFNRAVKGVIRRFKG